MERYKLITVSDVVFTVAIAAVAVIALFITGANKGAGAQAEFRKNGELLAVLPLSKDTLYEINGDYRNVFQISGGKVGVSYTDCPNKSCMGMGPISRAGEVIACAPNGITVSVKGVSEGIDAVTG